MEPAQKGKVAVTRGTIPGVIIMFWRNGDGRDEEKIAEVELDEVHGKEVAASEEGDKGVEGGGTGWKGRRSGHGFFGG